MDVFSYKGKHIQKSDRKYMRNAIPLFLGMLICMSCLAGGTLAWFTANQTAPVQLIRSAEYSVDVEVTDTTVETLTPIEVIVEENVASCMLTPNTSYSIKLTPTGTATKGYCLITDGDSVYTTGQLLVETTFEFTYDNGLADEFETAEDYDALIENTSDRNFAVAWYWGEYPNTLSSMTFSMEEPILLENGSVIGQPIAERPEETSNADNGPLDLELTGITAYMESGEFAVDKDCVIRFTADDGYTLPERITVEGVETYTYVDGVLTIPADQVQDGTEIVVTAAGMADPTEGNTTPTEPNTMPAEGNTVPTDPPETPIEEETASPESTTAPVEEDTTPTEPPATLSVDDIPTTESSGSTKPTESTSESTEGASPDESADTEE